MSTVILKWNPEFSSIRMIDFLYFITQLNEKNGEEMLNWSVREPEKIKVGDDFFFVKVGSFGARGIVSKGKVASKPYTSRDWAGTAKPRYYIDMETEFAINPDVLPILDSETLAKEIPDFEWTRGASGVVLNDEQAEKLKNLWNKFLLENFETLRERYFSPLRGPGDYLFFQTFLPKNNPENN